MTPVPVDITKLGPHGRHWVEHYMPIDPVWKSLENVKEQEKLWGRPMIPLEKVRDEGFPHLAQKGGLRRKLFTPAEVAKYRLRSEKHRADDPNCACGHHYDPYTQDPPPAPDDEPAEASSSASTLRDQRNKYMSDLYDRFMPMAWYLPPIDRSNCQHASKRGLPTLLFDWEMPNLAPPAAPPASFSAHHATGASCCDHGHHCPPPPGPPLGPPFSASEYHSAMAAHPKVIGAMDFMLEKMCTEIDAGIVARDEEIVMLQEELVKKNEEIDTLKDKMRRKKKKNSGKE